MGNMYHRSKSNLYAALFLLRPCLALVFSLPAQTPLHLHTLGLCDLCPSLEKQLLVFPGHKCGSLQLVVSCSMGRDGQVGGLALPVDSGTLSSILPRAPTAPSHCRTWRAQSLALRLLHLPSTHIRAM